MAEGGVNYGAPAMEVPAEHRTLLVQGLTPEISDELLELYFENPKCGGGDVESVKLENQNRARVVFKQHGVVENILEHGNHKFRGVNFFVSRAPVEERPNEEERGDEGRMPGNDDEVETRAILVQGLKPNIETEVLELFFENTKRSGGGEIANIKMYQKSGRAIIWFAEAATVQSVLRKGPLTLSRCELTVTPYVEEAMVKISGLIHEIPEETLELFFENTKRSGGGEIKSIDMLLPMQAAIITFEDPAVADRVVDKHTFSLSKCQLVAERYHGLKPDILIPEVNNEGPKPEEVPVTPKVVEKSPNKITKKEPPIERRPIEEKDLHEQEMSPEESSADEAELQSCSIEVSGVNKTTSPETLRMFFQNRRKSGGGKIDDVWHNKSNGNFVITFTNREAVERVLRKRYHKLEGAHLKVTEMQAACQDKEEITGPLEVNKMYVQGLSEKISRDQLELHLEEDVECDVEDVTYGLDPTVAMVTFKNKIDYRHLQKAFSKKHIQGRMLSMYKVPRPRELQVSNIGQISEDSLGAYFETRRSGGSGEVEVVIHKEHGCAIVTFETYAIAEKVLAKPKHRHEGRDLQLCTYRERLGIIPLNHDTSQPCVQIPTDVYVSDLDANKLHFLGTVPIAKKHAEEEVMRKLHAKIDWTHKSGTELHVVCTLRKDEKDVRKLAKDWEDTVKNAIHLLFSAIKSEKRECLKKTWKDVCSEMQKIRKGNPTIAVIERADESALYIVGKSETVKKIHLQIEKLCNEMEQKLDNIKDTLELKGLDKAVFQKAEQKQKFEKKYPKVKVTLKEADMELEGPAMDVLSIHRELTSFLRNMQKKNLDLSKGQVKVLTMLQRQPNGSFNNSLKKLEVVIQPDKDGVVLFGMDKDLTKFEEILRNSIKETSIEIAEDEKTAFEENIWQEFSNGLFMGYNGVLHLELQENSSVNLVAESNDFSGALEEVRNHIKKNAVKEVCVELETAQTRMILQWMVEDLKKIEKDFGRYSISISSPDSVGFLISGTEDGLAPAKTRIERLASKIITGNHTVTTPGMPHYFTQQEMGKYFIKSQEERHHVIIDYVDPNAEIEVTERKRRPVPKPRSSMKELQQATHPGSGVVIKVIVGDMTSHPVDAIVNAANSGLAHVGGLAKAIVDKGGRSIQTESDKHVQLNGHVMEGHVVITGAGKLPCKKVIHAVGPHWGDGRSGEEDILYDCVFSHILKVASQENFSSVAIPAISAGVFGFPLAVSTSVITEAVRDFLDEVHGRGGLSEIHLIDNRQEGGQAFVSALKKKFKVTQPAIPIRTRNGANADASARVLPRQPVSNGNQNIFRTSEGLTITLKTGTIATEQADMIFNTTAQGLNLHSGAVSKSIVEAAGNGIQTEVSQQCPNGLQAGQHVTSSGGSLSCQCIFHAVLCQWDNGQGPAQQLMKKIVMDSLTHGSQKGFTSIALPAMGTGNLHFPRDVVADTMFSTVIEFSKANPTTSLKDVRFVLYNKDQPTVDAFEDHLSRLPGSTNTGSSGTNNPSKRKVYKANSPIIENLPRGAVGGVPEPFEVIEPIAGRFQSPREPSGTGQGEGGGEITIGSIRLQVVPGDITQETTDAIVNGTNTRLDITQGAVSQAIANAGGAQLVQECKRKGHVNRNGVAITSGGALAARHVIHLDVQGMSSKTDWWKGITHCLQMAEMSELSSVSFPALGTGMLNISPSKMAVAMMEAIADFSSKNETTTTVSLVRVVIFQRDMIPTYLGQMDKATKPGSSIFDMVKVPFRYIGGAIKGWFSSGRKDITVGSKAEELQRRAAIVVDKAATTLDLTILALKKEDIETVKNEIQKCCRQESADITIFGAEYSNIIKFLDQFQIEAIENLSREIGVRITVDPGQRAGRIRLQGQSKDVYKADSKVRELLHKIRTELMEQQDAIMLAQFVQWESKEPNNQYQPYPAEINTKLEKAHSKGEQTVEWLEEEANRNIIKWTVDLRTMKETDGKITKDVHRRIIAEKGTTMALPTNWTPTTGAGVYDLVQLATTDQEYLTVSQEFQKTCQRRTIIKIERLQNKYLYRRYLVHKEDMDGRNPKGTQNERCLWHGTAGTSINSINTNGFNRSYCGQHGVAYGQGVYFAVGAQYSAGYSRPDANGYCQMYYAKVLTGEYQQGNPQLKTPPSKNDPKNSSLHYDSTVDRPGAPTMYVIYYDTQAYPDYIVTFQ